MELSLKEKMCIYMQKYNLQLGENLLFSRIQMKSDVPRGYTPHANVSYAYETIP